MPSTGVTVYSGSTLDDPPPPWQASSTYSDCPTMSTLPADAASSGSSPPSFFSRTASCSPIRREIAP